MSASTSNERVVPRWMQLGGDISGWRPDKSMGTGGGADRVGGARRVHWVYPKVFGYRDRRATHPLSGLASWPETKIQNPDHPQNVGLGQLGEFVSGGSKYLCYVSEKFFSI